MHPFRCLLQSVVIGLLLLCGVAAADSPPALSPADEAKHNELRALRDKLVEAMNKQDLDGMLALVHPEISYTPQDATPLHGPAEIRAYSEKMLHGPDRIVESLTVHPEADRLSVFFGDTAVVSGSSNDTFKLTDGRDFQLKSRWTATCVKENGRWLVASLHISSNLFDNPILDMVKKLAIWAGMGGFLAGLVIMGLLSWLLRKRPKPAT